MTLDTSNEDVFDSTILKLCYNTKPEFGTFCFRYPDIQLTEAEAAFRIHKSDLKIRPVWHQKTDRVLAHILVCFLAYVLWKTLHQMAKAAGLGDEPRRIFDELSKISVVDVVLPTRKNIDIRRRCVGKPTEHQEILLSRLGLDLPGQIKS